MKKMNYVVMAAIALVVTGTYSSANASNFTDGYNFQEERKMSLYDACLRERATSSQSHNDKVAHCAYKAGLQSGLDTGVVIGY